MTETQEFNLSVLENVTSFSTPLKDCSQYESIFSLIKEELDIGQTEDEGESNQRSAKKLRPESSRNNSESCDSEGVFKSPYKKNYSARSKSPRNGTIARAKRRSYEDVKIATSFRTPVRARSLGRALPGRSLQASARKHRSSTSLSDNSGISDNTENLAIPNGESILRNGDFVANIKQEVPSEERALEELLTMAQEQLSVRVRLDEDDSPKKNRPRNQKRSSPGSIGASDLSDSVENGGIINNRNKLPGSDIEENFEREIQMSQRGDENLLNAQEHIIVRGRPFDEISTGSNQGESASVSATDPLDIGTMDDSFVESSQSVVISDLHEKLEKHRRISNHLKTPATIKKNLHFDTGESDEENQNFSLSLSPEANSHEDGRVPSANPPTKQTQASTAKSTESINLNTENLDLKVATATTPQRRRDRKISQNSSVSTKKSSTQESSNPNSTMNEIIRTADPETEETKETNRSSSPANTTKVLIHFDPLKEPSVTPPRPRKRKTSQISKTNSQESLFSGMSDFEPAKKTSSPLFGPKKKKKKVNGTPKSEKSSIEATSNSEPASKAISTAPQPKKNKKKEIAAVKSEESSIENQSNAESLNTEISTESQSKKNKKKGTAAVKSEETLAEIHDFASATEPSSTPTRPKKQKNKGNSIESSEEDKITENSISLDTDETTIATLPRPKKRKPNKSSGDGTQEISTQESSSVESRIASPPKKRKKKGNQIGSPTTSTQNLYNLDPKHEANCSPPRPKNEKTSLVIESNPQEEIITDPLKISPDFDPGTESTAASPRPKKTKTRKDIKAEPQQNLNDSNSNNEISSSVPGAKKITTKAKSQEIASTPLDNAPDVEPKKEASPTPISSKRKKKLPKIVSKPQQENTNLVTNSVTKKKKVAQRSRKPKTNKEMISIPLSDTSNLDIKREASSTPKRTRKINTSVSSPLRGLTQELENCIMNNDFDQICENIDNYMETPSFTFETVQMLDEYDSCYQKANNKIFSKILSSPAPKSNEQSAMSIEQIGSSEDVHDVDPLYITKAEPVEDAIPSTSKKKRNDEEKSEIANGERTESSEDTETEGNCNKTKKEKTRFSERLKGRKRVSLAIKDSEDEDDESDATSDDDASSEEEKLRNMNNNLEKTKRRSSTRQSKKRVNMTISDWEDEGDLSEEAAELEKKVQSAKKKECLTMETLEKLDKIVVKHRNEVLPQHMIETRAGTTPLSYEQQMRFLEYESLSKDTYNPSEDQIIRKNWRAFCKDHDWNPEDTKPFLHFKHGQDLIMSSVDERRKFVQFLADGLPDRPLFSVYSRFKLLFHRYADAGARYSAKEDKKILAHMRHNPKIAPSQKCSELAKVMRRSRVSIWRRYRSLLEKEKLYKEKQKKKVLTKVTWDLTRVSEFITKLLDITISESLMELKDAFIPKVVWEKLQTKMGIHYDFLRRSWDYQFHMQLFSPEPICSNVTKIKLIEFMCMQGFKHSKEIEWYAVANHFDGCTTAFLRRMFNHLTFQASAALKTHNLSEILKFLEKKKIDQLRSQPKDSYLPRLCYSDRSVTFVPEDFMEITLSSKSVSDD